MLEHLRRLVERSESHATRGLLAREYLQARILETLQEMGAFSWWAFVGGTAARFVHGLPRFSEDLDFSTIDVHPDMGRVAERIVQRLARESYDVVAPVKTGGAVATASVRFRGLPYALGLTPHRDHVMTIRVEVYTRPPSGAGIEITRVRRHVLLRLCHYDRASLLAGKINATLTRPWTKGRDLYDLVWFLTDPTWPDPNLPLLNASLIQMGWNGPEMDADNWHMTLLERLNDVDWTQARNDVLPFLEKLGDVQYVSYEAFSELLLTRRRR